MWLFTRGYPLVGSCNSSKISANWRSSSKCPRKQNPPTVNQIRQKSKILLKSVIYIKYLYTYIYIYCIIVYYIVLYCIISYHIISYDIIWYYMILYYIYIQLNELDAWKFPVANWTFCSPSPWRGHPRARSQWTCACCPSRGRSPPQTSGNLVMGKSWENHGKTCDIVGTSMAISLIYWRYLC